MLIFTITVISFKIVKEADTSGDTMLAKLIFIYVAHAKMRIAINSC